MYDAMIDTASYMIEMMPPYVTGRGETGLILALHISTRYQCDTHDDSMLRFVMIEF